MNKLIQGFVGLFALGSGAFSVTFAATGNSHNLNEPPKTGGIYDNNTVTSKDPSSVRIQNVMVDQTPTPNPTQEPTPEPTPEPTQEPEPSPLPTPGTPGGGGGGGNPSSPPVQNVPVAPTTGRIRN